MTKSEEFSDRLKHGNQVRPRSEPVHPLIKGFLVLTALQVIWLVWSLAAWATLEIWSSHILR